MKSHQLLSDKDLQVLKVTYRTVIENYYENSSDENAIQLLLLNALTMQTISTREQSQSLLLVSMLEVFKVKAKSNKQLQESVQNTIIHLKNPLKIYLKDSTIQDCLEKISIYQLCCLVINRFYEQQMKPKVDTYNWKQIITRVSKNCDKNMPVALQTMIILLPNYSMYAKQVSKSGMIKYICSVYIPQVLQDKINLYRSLKVIKMVAQNDRSVLPSREKNIALVVYNHPAYILIVQQIQTICYDVDYSAKVLSNPKDIDPLYVWSYNSTFCNQASQRTIDDLQQMLKQGGKGISAQLQWKIYSTLNNIVKVKNYKISQSWKIPMNAQKNLNAYLKLMISMIEKNPNQFFPKVDMKAVQYVYDKSKTSDIVTDKLLKDLKNLDPALSNKKIGKLQASLLKTYTVQKNPEMLMEKAAKVPRNNQDLKVTQQILTLPRKAANEFEEDTIKTLKNKSIQSLKTAIINKYPINFADVFNNLNLDTMDPQLINKLLKLGQLHLTMDPDAADKYNTKKFLQILQWLENNQGDKIIDWIAASQMLMILFGPDEWKKHINEIPKRCFWLLNATNSELNGNLFQIISALPPNHPKLPIILGFISKGGDQQLKKLLMKSKLMEDTINHICNYKNNRSSVKSYVSRPDQDISDGEQMKKYLINVLNLSYFIYQWSDSSLSKQIQDKIIKPCLQNIIKCFHGAEHQFRFIENCLPYKLNVNSLKDMNVQRLLETHGRLTSYLHNNKYDGRLDFNKIASLPSEQDPQKIQQVLKFLKDNPDMIDGHDLYALLDGLLRNAKKDHKYWRYYPHYMGIINNILNVATKSNNPEVLQKITDFLQRIIGETAENDDITPEQFDQLYENFYNGLDRLTKRNVQIDTNRVKRQAEKVKDDEWKRKIMQKLKQMGEMKKVSKPQSTATRVSLGQQTSKIDQYVGNKYQSIPANLQQDRATTTRSNNANFEQSRIKAPSMNQIEQKKDENIYQGNIDTNQIIKKQQQNLPSQTPEEQRLLDALKMLKKIIKKQEPKQKFPKLVDIFMTSEFNQKRRYVLGHLLTQYFQIIERDKRCLTLLQMSDKTNLNRAVCFNFLSKFQQAFLISKRWKLIGNQFMDLAMERTKCRNQNKIPCVENGCQIAEYNLVKQNDVSYFESKKYHVLTVQLYPKIQDKMEAMYYLILVGSSARLVDIKTFYISNKLHLLLLDYVHKQNWMADYKIVSNIAYAQSSLVYTQNQIAIEVASKKNQMLKLMAGFKKFSTTKIVVDSSCSMLSNLCYSSKQVKQILYNYGLPQLLLQYMNKNIAKPEVSTYKQILRALGNISLFRPSIQKLIDGHIGALIVDMVAKFNILIYRDDEKMKLLKLTVDFISNMSTQKYKLQTLHAQGITNFVITLLQTTDISEDQVLMGCIDTIDGLCQCQQIQNYVVMDKKLLLQLIDLLKIKQDQRLITKSIRLLTNMTLNQTCIPYILQANLLSVLANIVLSVYRNQKIQTYINKIILRIYARKPDIKLILKSGYLDCLLKAIQISDKIDDHYIDILLHYSPFIPNYLNHRAFFNLVKLLTTKQNQKQVVEKCLKVFRAIFSSEERQEDDVLIQGATVMYEKLLQTNQVNRLDIIYLVGLHCTKSKKFKAQLQAEHASKRGMLLDYITKMTNEQTCRELAFSVLFAVLNGEKGLLDVGKEIVKQEDFAYKLLTKGFECKLFRMDGSSKAAIVDINQMYMIRAYKYPDGEIKKKYIISVRQLRDWQFMFEPNDQAWKSSVFAKTKGVFEEQPKIERCVTLLGSQQWGQFSLINLQFPTLQNKFMFVKAISALVLAFKSS